MECRKLFTERDDHHVNTCEFCGTVIHISQLKHENDPDYEPKTKEEIRADNENIGGHYCTKRFICPLANYGCEFATESRGNMTKHLEQDCLTNKVECPFCNLEMTRPEITSHKCCDFARAMVGLSEPEATSIIRDGQHTVNTNFLKPDEKK